MDIFLVRHGEAAAGWGDSSDPGLSTLGWQQARETALQLQPRLPNDVALLSSPLLRARQTAEPLARLLGREVQEAASFREIPAPVPMAQRQAWLRGFMQQQWPGQCDELLAWRAAAIQDLLRLQRPAVVFTHYLVINAVVGHVLERSETMCCSPANGSVTWLRQADARLELRELGQEMDTLVN